MSHIYLSMNHIALLSGNLFSGRNLLSRRCCSSNLSNLKKTSRLLSLGSKSISHLNAESLPHDAYKIRQLLQKNLENLHNPL